MFRATYIRSYVEMMQERGFEADAVLKKAGVNIQSLEDSACLVTLEQCRIIVSNMIQLTADSGLGFSLGMSSKFTDVGIVGHALLSARSMRQVVALWLRYGNTLAGSLLQLSQVAHDDDSWTLRVVDSGIKGPVFAFCVEHFMVGGIRYAEKLAGEPFVIKEVQFSYPEPEHVERYHAFFNCAITFNQPETKITITSPGLSQCISSDDDILNEMCVRHCHQVMRQIASKSPLVSRLRSRFLQSVDCLPSMEQIARNQDISVRTLRRQLQQEGTSYQSLVDQFRHDMAVEYLRSGCMAPKEVGYLLGFQSPSAFRRAFRRWTGMSVGDFLARIGHSS